MIQSEDCREPHDTASITEMWCESVTVSGSLPAWWKPIAGAKPAAPGYGEEIIPGAPAHTHTHTHTHTHGQQRQTTDL